MPHALPLAPRRPFSFTTSRALLLATALLGGGAAEATTTVTQSVDFEAPNYTVGTAAGQGELAGWNSVAGPGGGIVYASISNDRAYSGSQSLHTTADTRALNVPLVANSGEPALGMDGSTDWWAQTRVYVETGNAFYFQMYSIWGSCPVLNVAGNGDVFAHTCGHQYNVGELPAMGAARFNQWLSLSVSYTADTGVLNYDVEGQGFSWQSSLNTYSRSPGSADNWLGLSGDAYWDDVKIGTGAMPSAVPEPGALWMWAGAGLLGWRPLRKRQARAASARG